MEIQVDVAYIKVVVRCNKCSSVMHISDQYEYNDTLTIDVEPCDECEDE